MRTGHADDSPQESQDHLARTRLALQAVIRAIKRDRIASSVGEGAGFDADVTSVSLNKLLLDLARVDISLGEAELVFGVDQTTYYIRKITETLGSSSPASGPGVNLSATFATSSGSASSALSDDAPGERDDVTMTSDEMQRALHVVVDRCPPEQAEAVRARVQRESDIDIADTECDTLAAVARLLMLVTNPVGESIDTCLDSLARRKDARREWNLVAFLFVAVDSYATRVAEGPPVGKDVAGTLLRQFPIIADIRRVAQALRVLGVAVCALKQKPLADCRCLQDLLTDAAKQAIGPILDTTLSPDTT